MIARPGRAKPCQKSDSREYSATSSGTSGSGDVATGSQVVERGYDIEHGPVSSVSRESVRFSLASALAPPPPMGRKVAMNETPGVVEPPRDEDSYPDPLRIFTQRSFGHPALPVRRVSPRIWGLITSGRRWLQDLSLPAAAALSALGLLLVGLGVLWLSLDPPML